MYNAQSQSLYLGNNVSSHRNKFLLRKKINRRLSRWIKGAGRFKTILAGCNETQFISHIESQFVFDCGKIDELLGEF
jgi:hypothetical protein